MLIAIQAPWNSDSDIHQAFVPNQENRNHIKNIRMAGNYYIHVEDAEKPSRGYGGSRRKLLSLKAGGQGELKPR